MSRMAQRPISPQFFDGPFETPLPEAGRFGNLTRAHLVPEQRMSGDLPAQPTGLEVDAAPGNATPWRNLTSGR